MADTSERRDTLKARPCYHCRNTVKKDVIALNKKLIGRQTKRMMCPKCLADYLDCTEHDLDNLIVEFKTQGCALFS